MEFIRGLHNLRSSQQPCVLSIGNFDGLHLGHKALLKRLTQKAKELKLPSMVILFEPQPNEYFSFQKLTTRLMRLSEKIIGLRQEKIDRVLCIRFNDEFAKLDAEKFVTEVLVNKLGMRYILVGDDFKFGYQRKGDFKLLKKLAKELHFSAECMDTFQLSNERVSSTRVRLLLAQGDMKGVYQLLGRFYSLIGKVVHGDKRGRIMGFPTANIHLHRKAVPISGVFVVRVWGIGSESVAGVANIGTRPTVDGSRVLLEVHLFDFNQDIYGLPVKVEFLHKLRDEKRFENFEFLKQQIFEDVKKGKEFLG